MPLRLKAKRLPLLHRPQQPIDDQAWSAIALPRQRTLVRRLRVVRRLLFTAIWTLICVAVQAVLVQLPGRAWQGFANTYWKGFCHVLGLRVRVIGTAATGLDGRPVVFVSNHSSWLDIAVLGGILPASFIAKEEVGSWPVIGLIARLGRTVYVRRSRASTVRERDDMLGRLAGGDSLILFPEGTTSDGSRVLGFRSAFLSIAEQKVTQAGLPPIIQPVSVVYDRLAGLPAGRSVRPLFAWYGDMEIGSHFWRLAQHQGMRASVMLHPPIDPLRFGSRKALSAACWDRVAEGAARLRQSREPKPVVADAA